MLKPLKINITWPNLCKNKWGPQELKGHIQTKKTIFFSEITKPDHKLSKTFFVKYHVLAKLQTFFYFV